MAKQSGIALITKEREEQKKKHGWTVKKDREINKRFQLTYAARVLLRRERFSTQDIRFTHPPLWDYSIWEEMCRKSYKKRLVLAGALIAAEIDRVQK